jgi:hypothetical protein
VTNHFFSWATNLPRAESLGQSRVDKVVRRRTRSTAPPRIGRAMPSRRAPGGNAVAAVGAASLADASGNEGGRTNGWYAGQLVEYFCDGYWWRCVVLSVSSVRGVSVGYLDSPEEQSVRVAADSGLLRAKTDEWDEPGEPVEGGASTGVQRSNGEKGWQPDASRPSIASLLREVSIPPEDPSCRVPAACLGAKDRCLQLSVPV